MLRIFLELRFSSVYFSMLRIFGDNRISLFRVIHCTKYNLWTRAVDYGLAQLSARADRKKGILGKHNNDGSGNVMQKSFVVYSKILYVQNAFQLWWNEAAISGLEITRKKTCRQVTSSMQLQNRSFEVVYWKRTAVKCTKWKMHVQNVQNYSLSSLNMQICHVLVFLVALVT